ncbi:MAG: acyltransferase family protein [Acidobacteriaceae bacterium]
MKQFSGNIEIASTVHSPAQRILELDGLRGIAIGLVLMRHYIHHPSLLLLGPQWGWMGVNLFFVLSGFLITSILLRLTDQRGALKIFYARRSLRLFPLYFLALLVYFAASASVGTPQPAKTVFLYISFLQAFVPPLVTHLKIVPHPDWVVMGFGVLWSLSVEEYFYILWASLVTFTRAHRAPLLAILALILLLTPWARFFYPDPKGGQELFLAQMDSLAAGCLVAILWRDHGQRWRTHLQRHARWLYGCVAALIALAIWIDFATGITKRSVFDQRIFNATDYTVLWLAWSLWLLVTLAVSGTSGMVPRLLRQPLLRWLGRISYCLYIVHYPIYLALRNYLPHSVALIAGLAAALGLSAASWRYFEGPIARWKQHAFRYPMASEPEVPC